MPGAYSAGWIKRGPTGVIGTNKKDAPETVAHLLEDARGERLESRRAGERRSRRCWRSAASRSSPQTGWQAIDAAEARPGEPHGRPRVKLAEWDALLGAAGHEPAAR